MARARGCPADPRRPAGGPDTSCRRAWVAAREPGLLEPVDGSAEHAVALERAGGAGSGEDGRTAVRGGREARKYDKRSTGYSSSTSSRARECWRRIAERKDSGVECSRTGGRGKSTSGST